MKPELKKQAVEFVLTENENGQLSKDIEKLMEKRILSVSNSCQSE